MTKDKAFIVTWRALVGVFIALVVRVGHVQDLRMDTLSSSLVDAKSQVELLKSRVNVLESDLRDTSTRLDNCRELLKGCSKNAIS